MSDEKKVQARQGHNPQETAAVFADVCQKGYNPSAVSQVFTQLAQGTSNQAPAQSGGNTQSPGSTSEKQSE